MEMLTLLVPMLLGCQAAVIEPSMGTEVNPSMESAATIYDFKLNDIDGKPIELKKYKGKVLLVVNVASKCGLTPQYNGLEKLQKQYAEKGFTVLGFPANNFNGQEPGTNEEIKEFCSATYGVTFPMFTKLSVNGADRAPLYKWLIETSDRPKEDIEWNFAKFLVGKDGKVIARFSPRDTPESEKVVKAIEAALK